VAAQRAINRGANRAAFVCPGSRKESSRRARIEILRVPSAARPAFDRKAVRHAREHDRHWRLGPPRPAR
jgi:hypothetical protein